MTNKKDFGLFYHSERLDSYIMGAWCGDDSFTIFSNYRHRSNNKSLEDLTCNYWNRLSGGCLVEW